MNEQKPAHGAFDVVRKIPLAAAAVEPQQEVLHRLRAMEPIRDATVDKRGRLCIVYDTSRIGMHEIEALLDDAGIARAGGFWARQKLAWYRFLDNNARENSRRGDGACCNRPPAVPHGRGK